MASACEQLQLASAPRIGAFEFEFTAEVLAAAFPRFFVPPFDAGRPALLLCISSYAVGAWHAMPGADSWLTVHDASRLRV